MYLVYWLIIGWHLNSGITALLLHVTRMLIIINPLFLILTAWFDLRHYVTRYWVKVWSFWPTHSDRLQVQNLVTTSQSRSMTALRRCCHRMHASSSGLLRRPVKSSVTVWISASTLLSRTRSLSYPAAFKLLEFCVFKPLVLGRILHACC